MKFQDFFFLEVVEYFTMFCGFKTEYKLKFPVTKLVFTFCTNELFQFFTETFCMSSTVKNLPV